MMKRLMVGICTYNRKNIINYTSRSLKEVENIEKTDVRIYDDCSEEYDVDFLKQVYSMATKVSRNEKNTGADYNTRSMIMDFAKSDNDYLFIADSDLVFNKDILVHIEKIIDELEKNGKMVIFSLFNAHTHETIKEFNEDLVVKKEIGAAGTVISKKAVLEFINKEYNGKISIDNFFSNILREKGNEILCTKNSYVQHIGIVGQNSFVDSVDIGVNFKVDTITNAEAIIDILQQTFILNSADINDMLYRYCIKGKVGINTLFKCLLVSIKKKVKDVINRRK